MSFNARVFQIFIASPGDVQEERKIATEVIQRWNDLNAREKSLVLLPLRWETHSSPELGGRPQAIINRQVLDQCDLVVGIFWTRLGTPTGDAESGTAEEIERTGKAGKPVMLYFSNAKVDLETVDLDEYKRLRSFKTTTYPQGLVESYSSSTEFKEKLFCQLEIKIRDLVANDQKGEIRDTNDEKPSIDVTIISTAGPIESGRNNRSERRDDAQCLRAMNVEHITCVNENEIPDFSQTPIVSSISDNKNYIRELVQFFIVHRKFKPCRIAVMNHGVIGVPSISLQITLKDSQQHIMLSDKLPEPPRKSFMSTGHSGAFYSDANAVAKINKNRYYWEIEMDVDVVQAKRTILSRNEFFFGAVLSTQVDLETTLFSAASPPLVLTSKIEVEVSRRNMTYQEILKELGEEALGETAGGSD
jgi:hypothetical protein